ncbi:Anaphase-promoting complex (APC), subunit 11 [Handroanthus impetiginosus]|uniref:RING-type E3 ubiquitin transferase n=1 Tax=Handroanthus impetiginosus TaxID=429701 RepID=A0A2G9HK72_9LAMI|nr:Anaphase-promoting complex (APC), subunit 11 [Handroanthus impetiginosus]
MQGQRSSVSALPENLSFDHGSTSSDADLDSQMSWSNMQTSARSRLPDLRISPSESNVQYLQHARHEGWNSGWSLGETSSSAAQHQGDQNERKRERTWDFRPQAGLNLEERQYGPSNIISFDNGDVNSNANQTTNGLFISQNSSPDALSQDLNISPAFRDQEGDDCQVVERPSQHVSIGPTNEQMRSIGSSSDSFGLPYGRSGGYVMDESENGRRMSCKRKALEVHTGQSSGVGSSNCFQNAERGQRRSRPSPEIGTSNISLPTPTENDHSANNGSEQANPRLRLGVGGAVSASPFSSTNPGNTESSRRNFRVRINGLEQQDPIPENPFSTDADVGNVNFSSSSRHSARLALRNRLFDSNPAPAVENGSLHWPSLPVPSARRNHQSRSSGTSSTRGSFTPAWVNPELRNATPYEQPASRDIPRSISEHPMFMPGSETGSSSRDPDLVDWSMLYWGPVDAGNVASTSRANSSAPSLPHRSCPEYPRRLSEIVRRSLISSAGTESGSQRNNHTSRSRSANSLEPTLPSLPENRGHRGSHSRSTLLERHYDGAFGIPHSLRNLAAASEGRSIMSEQIRHVLDIMRRGEGLRLEDVMILDHSVLVGMADIHDRHRDMRLDVDNMSYEELLALEERIGNVCTGLSEETIMSRLKQQKCVETKLKDEGEAEPCSICREEYNDGEDLGILECGHEFHKDCIKQWLMQKNLCPICKTTGLNA